MTQPNRKAITTSPDLTLKLRARTTEDRNTTQADQKETQRLQRRTTRSTLADAAPLPSPPDGPAATYALQSHARHFLKKTAAHALEAQCTWHARPPPTQTGPAYVTLALTPAPLNVACPLLYPRCK